MEPKHGREDAPAGNRVGQYLHVPVVRDVQGVDRGRAAFGVALRDLPAQLAEVAVPLPDADGVAEVAVAEYYQVLRVLPVLLRLLCVCPRA